MNKKLIAAAIAAVVAAPAAVAADTTLYGKAHVDIRSTDGLVGGATNGDNYSVNSNASRLGIKGSEDLGNGLKAIFKYEMEYDIDGDDPLNVPISGARNAYVGLSGGFGTVLAGRHDTPAKVAFYASGTELVGDSVVDMNSIAQGVGAPKTFTEFRADNAIAYITPNFSGFTAAVAVVPGEKNGTNNTLQAANGLADAYSVGVLYAGGGLKAGIGYEVFTSELFGGGTAKDQKMWQAGGSYTFGDVMVGVNYENMSDRG
ncbi:MAG: porin, partial [Gammaproteobacteria bacterium]